MKTRNFTRWFTGIVLVTIFLLTGYQYYQDALSSFSEAFCLMDRANPGHENYPCSYHDLFGWHEAPPN
jgi:hypothetical protein